MSLGSGARLGPYEIIAPLGAGGMGEVYRGRDTQLGREVAIKILSEAFVLDPDRVARFEREAQLLAALNHPHIAAIYGLEGSGASRFLVLELVDGQTLAERLQGGALPVGDALKIARQIVDALEAAHEKGIVHRDLKPANIALTANGEVKVLDFGLAKAMEPVGSSGSGGLTNSPTLTFAATQVGVILGTAAYMSPEQAKGRAADKRSDVWAFGCVLFEMLTGERAFQGEDVSETLAAILRAEPEWRALPADVPPRVRTLLARCVEKDRRARVSDFGTVRYVLDESPTAAALSGGRDGAAVPNRRMPWAIAATFAALSVASLIWAGPGKKLVPAAPIRLTTDLGVDGSLSISNSGAAAILSPDGSMLAFVAQRKQGRPQLFVRRLDQLQATPLAGTDEALSPFFSPDGQWIAFFADGKLKKTSVTGGAAIVLADAPLGKGGTWSDDGTIIFSPANNPGTSLMRISDAGGQPVPLPLGPDEVTQRFPQLLPGGKAVLFMGHSATGQYEDANLVIQPLPSGARKVIVQGGYYPRYLPTGHVTYLHQGTAFAVPFDADRLEVTGPAVPIIDGVNSGPGGGAQIAFSSNGTVVYLAGATASSANPTLQWMDRSGKTTTLRPAAVDWSNPTFAPDGRRLAIDVNDGRQLDIWVYEWERDIMSRLTFDQGQDQKPVWTPDGRRIVFASQRDRSLSTLYWQRADGTGEVQRLTETRNPQFPASWHPTGRFLAFVEITPQGKADLMILPMEGDETTGWKPGKPTVFLNTPYPEEEPVFSPDGRWIAYSSNESGQSEVYVRPFPGPGGKWQISTNSGTTPTWSNARRELFYGTRQGLIMRVPFTVDVDSFRADKPVPLASTSYRLRPRNFSISARSFNLHPDGERFALSTLVDSSSDIRQDKMVFVFNFFNELRRLAPAKR